MVLTFSSQSRLILYNKKLDHMSCVFPKPFLTEYSISFHIVHSLCFPGGRQQFVYTNLHLLQIYHLLSNPQQKTGITLGF